MRERKQLPARVKATGDEGRFEAVFATLNVIDHDGDLTVPGAFTDGAEVIVSAYGHESWFGALPIGKATIRVEGEEAIAAGELFIEESAAAKETFGVMKRLGERQEWSYGFDLVKFSYGREDDRLVRFLEEIEVFEVSPVLRGAGINTRTLSAKSATRLGAIAHDLSELTRGLVDDAKALERDGELTDAHRDEIEGAIEATRKAVHDLEALASETKDGEGSAAAEDDEPKGLTDAQRALLQTIKAEVSGCR